jgi:hypothetical protein
MEFRKTTMVTKTACKFLVLSRRDVAALRAKYVKLNEYLQKMHDEAPSVISEGEDQSVETSIEVRVELTNDPRTRHQTLRPSI